METRFQGFNDRTISCSTFPVHATTAFIAVAICSVSWTVANNGPMVLGSCAPLFLWSCCTDVLCPCGPVASGPAVSNLIKDAYSTRLSPRYGFWLWVLRKAKRLRLSDAVKGVHGRPLYLGLLSKKSAFTHHVSLFVQERWKNLCLINTVCLKLKVWEDVLTTGNLTDVLSCSLIGRMVYVVRGEAGSTCLNEIPTKWVPVNKSSFACSSSLFSCFLWFLTILYLITVE